MSITFAIPKKYVSPEFIEKVNQVYHDIEAKQYDAAHPEILNREQLRWKRLLDITNFNKYEKLSALDIGTGTGFAAYQVLSRFPNAKIKCVDISEQMLIMARKNLNKSFPNSDLVFELNPVDRMDLQSNNYDLITINSVLHHLPDPFITLEKLIYSLAPGGFLIISHEPNYRFYSNFRLFSWTRRMQNLRSYCSKYFNPSRYLNKILRICRIIPPPKINNLVMKTFKELCGKGYIEDADSFEIAWIGALVDFHIPRIRAGIAAGSLGLNIQEFEAKLSPKIILS